MCTRRQLDKITEQMRECYFSIYGTNVVKIVLYGSYARGDFDEGSDIDIVAIVKGKREELQKKLRQIWDWKMMWLFLRLLFPMMSLCGTGNRCHIIEI